MTKKITSGINGTSENLFYLGDGADGYKILYANSTQDPPPAIRNNPITQQWEVSHDGVNYTKFEVLDDYPRGVENIDDSDLTWDDVTLTLTHGVKSPATSFKIFEIHSGTKQTFEFTTSQSVTITSPVVGQWLFYYEDGILTTSQSFPISGFKTVFIAIVYLNDYNETIAVLDERHCSNMPWKTHQYLHESIGTKYGKGFDLTRVASGTGSANGDSEIILTGGTIWDEDIEVEVVNSATPTVRFEQKLGSVGVSSAEIPIYFRLGDYWNKLPAISAPLHQVSAGQRPAYNRLYIGSWGLWEITQNNKYAIYYICGTNNLEEPVVAIVGQGDYTLLEAQHATFSDLSLGSLFTNELKPFYKLIYKCNTTYTNDYKSYLYEFVDLRNTTPLPVSAGVTEDHQALTGRETEGCHSGSSISLDTSNFTNNLSEETNTTQLAMDTLDSFTAVNKWNLFSSGFIYDGYAVKVSEEMRHLIDEGHAIRFLDGWGRAVATSGSGSYLSDFHSLTGLITAIKEDSGRLYVDIEDLGGGFYSVNFYTYFDFVNSVPSGLVGYTESFSTTGSQAVYESNGSGLGGSIVVTTLGAQLEIIEFYRWGIIDTITQTGYLEITWVGHDISDYLSHVWFADSSRVVQIPAFIPGTITNDNNALETVNFQFLHYNLGSGRIVQQTFRPQAVNTVGCQLEWVIDQVSGFGSGLESCFKSPLSVNAASLFSSSKDVDETTSFNRIRLKDRIDVKSTASADGSVSNIACSLTIVLE